MGNVWSFNFFFYNRKQKRILYFACRGKTHAAASSSGEESSECAYNSDAEVCTSLGSHLPLVCLATLSCDWPRSDDDAIGRVSACEMGGFWMWESK